MRPKWIYAALAVLGVLAVVLGLSWWRGPALIPLDPPTGQVTIAGQLVLDPAEPASGGLVTARATLSAERDVVLSALTVKVRDEAGAFHDFPTLVDAELSPEPRVFETQRELPAPGTYTYYLAYQLHGTWVSLPPWQRVTVR
ncbi:hypothetical protein HDA40_001648 [Hamadaea flava]|uniref:YtkA-like domain-containing protein n=1 Tax=Hamadaea flava TaxID=1742688 RepID=A0ABV8LNB6_9ACTN|nr:hypothetical protein [Hamadaea flava]MCP2323141.1 hypothetical protein [Hamadaea flava]